jgi:hypothetical protein
MEVDRIDVEDGRIDMGYLVTLRPTSSSMAGAFLAAAAAIVAATAFLAAVAAAAMGSLAEVPAVDTRASTWGVSVKYQGLADITRRVKGCRVTQDTRTQRVLDDGAWQTLLATSKDVISN